MKINSYMFIDDMQLYLSHTRLAYENMLEQVKPNADVILNGSLPQNELVEGVIRKIRIHIDHFML